MGTETRMRELFVISGESTHTSLLLRTAPEGEPSDAAEEFFLVLDDAARSTLLQCLDLEPTDSEAPVTDSSASHDTTPELDALESHDLPSGEDHSAHPDNTHDEAPLEVDTSTPQETPEEPQEDRPHREIDPALTRPLSMRPREIQDRIRAGASVRELAEIMKVAESRVEPYAYPVLAEREGITELAKHAYPIVDDKPSSETLYEVLAQAFASRNFKLSSAHWDSYRDESKQWIVRLSWQRGLSLITAEWAVHRQKTGHSTVEPVNAEAADLIDPNFVRPVRRLATITSLEPKFNRASSTPTSGNQGTPAGSGSPEEDSSTGQDSVSSSSQSEDHHSTPALINGAKKRDVAKEQPDDNQPTDTSETDSAARSDEDSFLLNPTPSTSRRRKKSTAPRWEDVLLGIRTNTKHSRK